MAAANPRPVLVELAAPEPVPPASAESPLLLRVEEAARLLNLSRTTIYELVKAGELPAVHIGRTTRVPRRALDGWIQRQTTTAAKATSKGWQRATPESLVGGSSGVANRGIDGYEQRYHAH